MHNEGLPGARKNSANSFLNQAKGLCRMTESSNEQGWGRGRAERAVAEQEGGSIRGTGTSRGRREPAASGAGSKRGKQGNRDEVGIGSH